MAQLSVVTASRKPKDDEDAEDFSKPPKKIRRDAFGYVPSGKPGGCSTCYFFDKAESECELFEAVQESNPELFSLNKKVAEHAGCEAHIIKKEEPK